MYVLVVEKYNQLKRSKQVLDSPVQVDIDKMSKESLNNLKEVYSLMSLLLEENSTIKDINDKDAVDLLSSLSDLKIRDGVLKYFTLLPKDMRLDVLKNFTLHLDYAARNNVPVNLVADSTGYLGALMVLEAAFKLESGDDDSAEMEIARGLFKDAAKLGSNASLLRLLNVAVVDRDIPATVFKDSIDAVTLEACVSK